MIRPVKHISLVFLLLLSFSCTKENDPVPPGVSPPFIPNVLIKRLTITRTTGDAASVVTARPANNDSNFDYARKASGAYRLQLEQFSDFPFLRIESTNSSHTIFDIRAIPGTAIRLFQTGSPEILLKFQLADGATFRFNTITPIMDTTEAKIILLRVLRNMQDDQYDGI